MRSRASIVITIVLSMLCVLALVRPASAVEFGLTFDRPAMAGAWSRALDDGLAGEVSLRGEHGRWRPGFAVFLGSWDMPAPNAEATWSHIALFADLGLRPWRAGRVEAFVTARVGWARLRPESRLFLDDPDRELEPGENPFDANEALEVGLLGGVLVDVAGGVALELGATAGALWSQDADLSAVGAAAAGSGRRWGLRLGVVWNR